MRIAISRHGLVVAALWAAFLYLLFLALAVAPKSGIAGEPPQALVAWLVRTDDPTIETWQVLTDLGAGEKPRLLVYNKADLVEPAAQDGETPAPTIAGSVLVSALSGYGMGVLRARLAALLADLWEEVDVSVPYSEGELLSRVRERGTVDIGYRARDVRVRGRVAPSLASELRAAAFGRNGAQ